MAGAEQLVGRDAALAAASAAFDSAISGAGQFVLVSGEAGIGKSAVLAAVISRAERDCVVLRGSCWDGAGVPPYWPWSQALRGTQLPAAELREAAWLVGSSAPVEPAGAAASADAQFRLFDAVSRCLGGLAAARPLVVVLDDLHWADEPSLTLLAFLARTLAADRVLLLGAYRDAEASAQLRQLLGTAQHISLFGLSQAEVEAMIAALPGVTPPPTVTAQFWQRSGGNPFFVRELTRLVQAQGNDQAPGRLPVSVAETLRRRLARLSTACVQLLDWAAVAGPDIDVALLVRSGAVPDEAVALALLDEAGEAGVITAAVPPRFAHDLYRETILEGLHGPSRAAMNLAIGRALQERPGSAAQIATHLLSAGAPDRQEAADYCVRAAREATARLGHEEACTHYMRALPLIDDDATRGSVLLELAAAHARVGMTDEAMRRYREAADLARRVNGPVALAEAALGIQALGHRSGALNAQVLDLLRDADQALAAADGPLTLRSRVLAAVTRALRHGSLADPGPVLTTTAEQAVRYARASGDPNALAAALLAVHDARWNPGTADIRLPVIAEMLDAASAGGNAELVAQAHLLRAAALLEVGEPAGRDELLTYIALAGELGTARGRWGALTRHATFAQIAGRVEEAAKASDDALELGRMFQEPDALGCFCTLRWSLVALGVDPPPDIALDEADPLWPMFPLVAAWPLAVRGQLSAATQALGDFSVLDIPDWTDLESLAVAAVVFAAVGTGDQRRWAYEQLRPYAGTHVIVGGCAAYHAAVDHHLGMLARSLGDLTAAQAHLRAALAMHDRLGAAAWVRCTEQALADLLAESAPANEFRFADGRWHIGYRGTELHLPDAKGLRDLWVLIGARGADVHVNTLVSGDAIHRSSATGADPVLDARARAEFKARLDTLARQIEDAEDLGHTERADHLHTERDALIHELAAATGLGGRSRRLGDPAERARKTVSARIRDALAKIDLVDPALALHLRQSLRTGTTCAYAPAEATTWKLT